MAKVHQFVRSLRAGAEAEAFLDSFFQRRFDVEIAGREEQRRGIDRWFTDRRNGKRFAVEYKADFRAQHTHNAYIETVSVDCRGKPGWAFTTRATFLVYYVPGYDLIYVLRPGRLRRQIQRWARGYPTRPAQNDGYRTLGICVPLHEFEQFAEHVINLADCE